MIIKKILKILFFTILDISLISLIVFSNYYFVYLMPHKEKNEENKQVENSIQSDKDLSENIQNNSTYKSSNVSVTISKKIYVNSGDSSIVNKDSNSKSSEKSNLDLSNYNMYNPSINNENSKDEDLNKNDNMKNTTNYYVADIYIANINSLKTHFAKSTYGTGYTDSLLNMSKENKSIISINGDSYSYNKSKNSAGPLIRNGTVYRLEDTTSDVCILYNNGVMETYTNDEYKLKDINYDDVYQTWVFGPCLLDKEGKASKTFNTSSYIKGYHPRTAIGYFSPGHYCFVVVDGRGLNSSNGLLLDDLAKIFESLGCKSAYNLDGGHCSFMTFNNDYINSPSNKSTEITDGIFIEEVN